MSQFLDKFLAALQDQLPKSKGAWLSDLRTEAAHIPVGFARLKFQWSGLIAAIGCVLRVRVGVQKIGQILLASALCIFYLAGLIFTMNMPDESIKLILNVALPTYLIAAVFAVMNLRVLKRFTLVCSFLWALVWVVLSLGAFDLSSMPLVFLRAISIEAAFMLAALFIVASYLGWIEDGRDA